MASRTLTFDITTQDQQTIAALKRIQRELKETGDGAQRTTQRTQAMGSKLSGWVGGLAAAAGGKYALGQAEEAEQVARKAEAAFKATGNAAKFSLEQQDKLSTELSGKLGIDDDEISAAITRLRSYTNVVGETFKEAIPAALDFAAAKGIPVEAAIDKIGKALANPAKGARLLRIELSAQQKEQMANLQATGDLTGQQAILLSELEKRYKGQAEAAATGSQRMKVAIDNLAESAGTALVPIADGIADVASGFTSLPQPIQTATLALGGGAAAAFKLKNAWEDMSAGGKKAALAVGGITTALTVAAGAYDELIRDRSIADFDDLGLVGVADVAGAAGDEIRKLAAVIQESGWSYRDLAKWSGGDAEALKTLRDEVKKAGLDTSLYDDALRRLAAEEERAAARKRAHAGEQRELNDSTAKGTQAISDQAEAWYRHAAAVEKDNEQIEKMLGFAHSEFDANERYNQSQAARIEAEAKLEWLRKGKAKPGEIAAQEDELAAAIEAQAEARGEQAAKTAEANGKTLTASERARIEKAEVDRLTESTGLLSENLAILVVRYQQVIDQEKELARVRALIASANQPWDGSEGQGELANGRPAPQPPGGPTRSLPSAPMIRVDGDLVLGGKHGTRQIEDVMHRADRKRARHIRAGGR